VGVAIARSTDNATGAYLSLLGLTAALTAATDLGAAATTSL
jgi:hypothetical protein